MDWFMMIIGYSLWIFIGMTHIFYAEEAAQYAGQFVKQCICDAAHIKKGATLAEKFAAEDYARDQCEEKCGMPEMKCGLDRKDYTYAEYKKQCRAARDGAEPATTEVASPAATSTSDDGW